MKKLFRLISPVEGMPTWEFWLRVLVIAVELILAYCLAEKNNPFFYQAF